MQEKAFFCFTPTVVPLFCQSRVTFSATIARLCLLKLVDTLLTVPLDSTVAVVTACGVKPVDVKPRAVSHSSIGV